LEEKLRLLDPTDTQIANLFHGTVNHSLRCLNIDWSSNHSDDFYDVSLVVKSFPSLEDSLRSFIADEYLTGDNQYKVNGEGQDAVMFARFGVLPPVLHFHLTRFEYSATSVMGMVKVKDRFEFPLVLDMSPYCENATQECVYELFSVLVHIGDNWGGHYVCYCRPTPANVWYKFNDSIISLVEVTEAVDNNFGALTQSNQAYYLAYIRKSDIPWVMHRVVENEIPMHLIEYFEKQRDLLDPKMITITVANHHAKPQFRVALDTPFENVLREVQKVVPNCKHLWTLDNDGFPLKLLRPKRTVKETFQTSTRVFAGEFVLPNLRLPSAYFIEFFFPESKQPLQELGYHAFDNGGKVELALPLVNKLAGFPAGTKLLAFHHHEGKVTKLKMDAVFGKDLTSGVIIFQRAPESAKATTTFTFPQPSGIDAQLVPARDLIGIKLETAEAFVSHIKTCIRVRVHNFQDERLVVLEIPAMLQLRFLLICIGKALSVPADTGIALYLPFPDDESKRNPIIINRRSKIALRTALDMRGRLTGAKVFMRTVPGVGQAIVDTFVPLSFPLMNSVFDHIADVHLELPSDNSVIDIFRTLASRDDVPPGTELRLLLIHKAMIVGIIPPTQAVVDLEDHEFRVEFVPEDQRNMSDGILVKCAFSCNYKYPPNGCFLSPFLLKVEHGETFDMTKGRILSLMPESFGECGYVLYLGRMFTPRFCVVHDAMLLADIGREPDAVLYILVNPEDLQRLFMRGRNAGVRIYN
jgi:hypothetical protein